MTSSDFVQLTPWQEAFVATGLATPVGHPRLLIDNAARKAERHGITTTLLELVKRLPERHIVVAALTKIKAKGMRDAFVRDCLPEISGAILVQNTDDILEYCDEERTMTTINWKSHAIFYDERLPGADVIVIDDAFFVADMFFTWLRTHAPVLRVTRMILASGFSSEDDHKKVTEFMAAGVHSVIVAQPASVDKKEEKKKKKERRSHHEKKLSGSPSA